MTHENLQTLKEILEVFAKQIYTTNALLSGYSFFTSYIFTFHHTPICSVIISDHCELERTSNPRINPVLHLESKYHLLFPQLRSKGCAANHMSGTEPSFRENPSEIILLHSRVRNSKEFRLLPQESYVVYRVWKFSLLQKGNQTRKNKKRNK